MSKSNLYLFKNYNNYYNRLLKLKETLNDYIQDNNIYINEIQNVNFDIQDGINTKAIINYSSLSATPNYCIVENVDTHEFNRWFVLECRQTRGLQFELTLRRDVIADFYTTIKHSPCIIQKGYVGNDKVLVFNKEQQEYNKVKQDELLIKDSIGIGYIVGFIARDSDYSNIIKSTYDTGLQVDFDYDALSTTDKNYFAIGNDAPTTYFYSKEKSTVIIDNIGAEITFDYKNGVRYIHNTGKLKLDGAYYINSDFNTTVSGSHSAPNTHLVYQGEWTTAYPNVPTADYARDVVIKPLYQDVSQITTGKLNNITSYDYYRSLLGTNLTRENYLKSFVNKICLINGVYYKASWKQSFDSSGTWANDNYVFTSYVRQSLPTNSDLSSIGRNYNGTVTSNLGTSSDGFTTTDITIGYNQYKGYLKLTPINVSIYTRLTSSSTRNHLIDNPYDMFVIPYDDDYSYTINSVSYTANKSMAINIAQSICEASGSTTYDIQIVPYCPFSITSNDWSLINKEAIYKDPSGNTGDDGTSGTSDDVIIGYYFWADKSSRTLKIAETRSDLTLSNNPSYKEITQLRKYILCSPDEGSKWEFNPAMNQGITEWNVSFDYRPYSSYIKIQPKWQYLYGTKYEYNELTDYRGLIFNGTFSLTQLNDAWANYLNNNKNYQQIFDTQITTQQTQYSIQNKAAWDTLVGRSITWGAISSYFKTQGNIKEQEMNEKLQGVSLEAQRKLFDLSIDNIKNVPDTIKKLTSINIDFKIFPFVEIYECTESEKLIFEDEIRYNGMTINATGYIENYLKDDDETFIQATLIRYNDNLDQESDYTLVQTINEELNKGIYIYKEV